MPPGRTPKTTHVKLHTVTSVNIVGQTMYPGSALHYRKKSRESGEDNHFKAVCRS